MRLQIKKYPYDSAAHTVMLVHHKPVIHGGCLPVDTSHAVLYPVIWIRQREYIHTGIKLKISGILLHHKIIPGNNAYRAYGIKSTFSCNKIYISGYLFIAHYRKSVIPVIHIRNISINPVTELKISGHGEFNMKYCKR